MTDDRQAVSPQAAVDREACVRVLRELLRTSAGGEVATQRWVAAQFTRLGCRVDEITFLPRDLHTDYEFAGPSLIDAVGHSSVVGRLAGSGGGRSLLLFAHPDCEPANNITGWRRAPFAKEIENGRFYGWGVADDLLGVATMICALKTLSVAKLGPRGTVMLASAPSKRHTRGITAVMKSGYRADAALYLHPAESGRGLKEIKAITPGVLRFRIAIAGRPAPTWEPEHTPFHHRAVNPIEKACVIMRALKDLDERRARERRHPALQATAGRSTNLQLAHVHAGHPEKLNRVPTVCAIGGSISFPPDEPMRSVQAQVEVAIQDASAQDPWLRGHLPQVEWLMGIAGAEIPLDHPFYKTTSTAIHSVTQVEPEPYSLHAASDIRHPILYAGIPCVGIGPLAGDFTQAGGQNEWVDVDDYLRFVNITAHIIMDWCGVNDV